MTRFCAATAKLALMIAVAGLCLIVAAVAIQVFGRYVLNDTPTWAEAGALVLVIWVTMLGAAVGVRDAGHIGMDSILVLVPDWIRNRVELLIHVLVCIFGVAMAYNGWVLGASVAPYKLANINLSEGVRYVPLVISGVMVVLFSIEHFVALLRGEEVVPSWH